MLARARRCPGRTGDVGQLHEQMAATERLGGRHQSVFPAKLWRSRHVSLVPEYAPRTNCAIPFLTNGLPQCRNAYPRRFPDGYAPVGGPRLHALTRPARVILGSARGLLGVS